MKKLLLLLGMALIIVNVYAQTPKMAYAGVTFNSFKTSQMTNFDISDWVRFGTGSSEGRVRVPLEDVDMNGMKFGVMMGAENFFTEKISGLVEGQINFGSGFWSLGGVVGSNYYVTKSERFLLGVGPKLGFAYTNINFGQLKMLPGKREPVIIEEGTFTTSDTLNVSSGTAVLQLTVTPTIVLTQKLALRIQTGYSIGLGGTAKVYVASGSDDVTIEMDSPAIVTPDGKTTQAGLKPKVLGNSGLFFNVCMAWVF